MCSVKFWAVLTYAWMNVQLREQMCLRNLGMSKGTFQVMIPAACWCCTMLCIWELMGKRYTWQQHHCQQEPPPVSAARKFGARATKGGPVHFGNTSVQAGQDSGDKALHLNIWEEGYTRCDHTGVCKTRLQHLASYLLWWVERTYSVRKPHALVYVGSNNLLRRVTYAIDQYNNNSVRKQTLPYKLLN